MAKTWLRCLLGGRQYNATVVLDRLARNRTPIQAEIEESRIRFQSQLSLKETAVILAKPATLGVHELHAGEHVRIRWAGAEWREMRLSVAAPHFNLPGGGAGVLCRLPDGSMASKRRHERYDTSRFTNLHLHAGTGTYRVLDLCGAGCRLMLTADPILFKLPLGNAVPDAALVVGKASRVEFETLIPLYLQKASVGCEFRVKQDRESPRIFTEVLASVQSRQFARMRAV